MARTIPGRDAFAPCWQETVRWADVDAYGHVNNVAYYAYVDSAVNGWLMTSLGVDVRTLPSIGVVAQTSCQYFSEIDFPAQIQVGLALGRLGNSSVVYDFGIFTADSDLACACGRFVHVYVDRSTRRPTSVPEEIRQLVSGLPARAGGPRGHSDED